MFKDIVYHKYCVEADYRLNQLLPPHPLFHATPAAVQILADGEGVRTGKGSRWYHDIKAICLTRDVSWLLDGKFGNAILVFDRDELKTKFKIEPMDPLGYMSGFEQRRGEREERVFTNHIPVKYIKAMITLGKPYKNKDGSAEYTALPWPQTVKYIYWDRDTNKPTEIN